MADRELPAGAEVILSEFLDRLKRQGYSGDQLVEAGRRWRANFDEDMMKRGGFDELERVVLEPEPEIDGLEATLAGLEDQATAAELRDILGALDDGFTVAEDTADVAALDGMAELSRDIESLSPQAAPDAPRLSLSDPLQMGQAELAGDIATLGEELALAQEPAPDVPTYRNEEAAARLAARQQAEAQKKAPEATPAAPTPGYERGWKDWTSLGLGLGGAALGALAPMIERDRGFEAQLRERAGGDTIARREGALAAGQLARGIRGASLGRRDISPALAMRNAQMAAARAGSDVMAQAAIASARERQAAQQQLADIRKARVQTQINAGLGALSATGAWLSSQGAAQKQDARAQQQLAAAQERNRLQAEQNQLFRDSMPGRGKVSQRTIMQAAQPVLRRVKR